MLFWKEDTIRNLKIGGIIVHIRINAFNKKLMVSKTLSSRNSGTVPSTNTKIQRGRMHLNWNYHPFFTHHYIIADSWLVIRCNLDLYSTTLYPSLLQNNHLIGKLMQNMILKIKRTIFTETE